VAHFSPPSTARPSRVTRYLPILLGLLLILSPLATQAAPPPPGAEASLATLSQRDWAAIAALQPALLSVSDQHTYFKASNPGSIDDFGLFMAMSGETLVVGAPNEASSSPGVNGNQNDNSLVQAGAAYVFVRTGGTWSQQAYLKASNPGYQDYFGVSVGISGDTIVVGARGEASASPGVNGNQNDNSAHWAGAAYVFIRNGTTWTQQAYLKASNPGPDDSFGETVFIDGSTIVVGASKEDSAGSNQADNSAADAGAAYVFVRNGTTWSQQAYLKASNPAAGDVLSYSGLAMSGETLVIGARGEDSGLIGNPNDNSATDAGAAYVFVRNGTTWSQQAYLKASNPGAGDLFGRAAAISGDTIVVGAYYEDSAGSNQADNSATDAGAAYVFVRSGTTWSQQAYLKAANAGANDWFGHSAALSGDILVIGARGEGSANGDPANNSAPESGATYVFERSGATWTQQAYLKADFPDATDLFGHWVALSQDTILVGAPFEDSNASGINGNQADNSLSRAGAVYSFLIEPTLSISDVTVLEGDSGTRTATFSATLSMPGSQPITATYAIGGGTATPDVDYTVPTPTGTLRFEPGQTVRTLAVTISGDLLDEPNETFSVTLIAPVNASAGDLFSLGTIIDDDAPAGAGSRVFLPRLHHTITQLLCVINASAIPISVPAQPGEIFYTTTITIPAELPAGGRFYLSSSPTSAQPALVDDELLMLHGATTIFSHVYSTSRPVPQLVEVPRATLAAVAGQTVTVQFADRYSGEVQSTPMYLIWQLP
jgi:hypothetical protein